MSTASKTTRLTDGPDCRRRGHQHFELKPFATLTPGKAWGSSPFGVRLAAYDSRLLQLCRSSDIHGTLEATKPRYASEAAPWLPKPCPPHPRSEQVGSSRTGTSTLPWVSLGDEPFSPEGWDGDQAVKAGGNAPQAPLNQGGEGSGIAPGSAMAGFFSARVVRWTASHMPVDTAQNSASAMIRMSRSSRPASLI